MNLTHTAAIGYIQRGWSVIPIPHGAKGPTLKGWPMFRIAAGEAADCYFGTESNIGLLLGEASGNLVCIDLDHEVAVELAERFLPPTGLIAGRTLRPGTHRFYVVTGELKSKSHKLPGTGGKTTVEILSTGRQVVVGPSVHPTGDVYDMLGDGEAATVDAEELREAVETLHLAVLDTLGVQESPPTEQQAERHQSINPTALRPGDDFNDRGDIRELLCQHGWQFIHGGANEHWRRPGKDFGTSATLKDGKLFYVFSSAAAPFEPSRCYDPFGAFTILEHGGDFSAATGALRAAGYGDSVSNVDVSGFVANSSPPDVTPRRVKAVKSVRSHSNSEAIVHRLSDVEPEQLEWLWLNRFPLGKLSLLAGDPGLGKSFVTCDMAARVSCGAAWPDDSSNLQPIGSVVMFNCEDGLADTIRPRLDKARADVSKIVAIEGVRDFDSETGESQQRGFTLGADLSRLGDEVAKLGDCRLVVIDPVSAYCGETDSHKNADVRALLAPLAELAERHRVAVVMVTHLSKSGGNKAVYRSMGSLAFTAAARAAWHVMKDPDDPARRLILPAKMNLAPDPTGLAYRIEDGGVHWEADPVKMNADELLAIEANGKPDTNRGQRDDAAEWLRDTLASGGKPSKDVIADGKEHGHSDRTLRRAFKENIGGKPVKTAMNGGWMWSLPSSMSSPDDAVPYLAGLDTASLFPPLTPEDGQLSPKMLTP